MMVTWMVGVMVPGNLFSVAKPRVVTLSLAIPGLPLESGAFLLVQLQFKSTQTKLPLGFRGTGRVKIYV
ncbi:hypothetical protein CSW29_10895 [Thermus scotoductus]|uniref:Uncharacterized protein n=1 Tax=Thermus scotoductus TaxID=37636 RepID=A0A430UEW0_THESC|nr:hypothetical protein CSW29_10895 [Thermus scotoductus]